MLIASNATCQRVFSHVYNYNFRDGLSIGVVQMASDKDGNIWFKDHNTLGKYNGVKFNYFTHDEEIINSCPLFISDLIADLDGNIWLSAGDGLYKYTPQKGFIRHLIIEKDKSQVSGFVTLSSNKANQLWCGNKEGKILLYDQFQKQVIKQIKLPSGSSVRKLYQDSNDQCWIVSSEGIFVFTRNNQLIKLLNFEIQTPYPDNNLFKILESIDGKIFINYKVDLFEFDKSSLKLFTKHQPGKLSGNNHINDFIELNKNIFLIASDIGLFKYNIDKQEVIDQNSYDFPKEFKLESDLVQSILYSKNNILFLGTSKGMSKIQSNAEQFVNFDLGQNINSLISLIAPVDQWNNQWIVVTESDGIFKYGPRQKTLFKLKGFSRTHVQTAFLSIDQKELFWIEGNDLYRGQLGSDGISFIKLLKKLTLNGRQKIKQDSKGNFWFFRNNNVYQYNPTTDVQKSFSTPAKEIVDLLITERGEIYIGGTGLYKLRTDGQFDSLPINTVEVIHSLEEGQNGDIYAGAYSGLLIYDPLTSKTKKLSLKNGLLKDYTGNLKKNGNYLWITYLDGIQRMDMSKKKIETYSYENGLADNYSLVPINVIDSNTICLGKFGFFTYQKNVPQNSLLNVSFSVENISIDTVPYKGALMSGSVIDIPALTKQILINFNFPAYLEKSLFSLEYRLKSSHDTTWKKLNHDLSLEFLELIPNTYKLEIRALDKNNPTSIKNFYLMLMVSAPFYQTLLFQISVLLLSCFLVGLIFLSIYRFKINQLKKLENLRLSISRDLHDEMGSNISSIKLLSEFEVSKSNAMTNTSYHKIAARSSEIMEGMSDIVWSINPANDDMSRIIEKMQSYAMEVLEPKGLEVELEYDESLLTISLNLDKRRNLYLIFKEAINNITKYANANRVKIELRQINKSLVGEISDDGKGFDISLIKNGNGLGNMNNRAKLLEGNLKIASSPEKGTKINLEFPI